MEHSISSIAFKGSVLEAISEAKRQKKLFVVYISGLNEDTILLDKDTWTVASLAESVGKYCILLHITEGSEDAIQFSALYPQKPAPCITAISYTGVQLWQNEGFIGAESLRENLEKMWLSFHIQETTATFLTAALSSRTSEPLANGSSLTSSTDLGSSSVSDNPSSSTDLLVNTSEATPGKDLGAEQVAHREHHVEDVTPKHGYEVTQESSCNNELESVNIREPVPSTDVVEESINAMKQNENLEKGFAKPEVNLDVADHSSGLGEEAPKNSGREDDDIKMLREAESVQVDDVNDSVLSSLAPNDVHLNIRLPGSVSLQEKFPLSSTLSMVKDYVDERQESFIGPYDLAIPYPRKVFDDQDLGRTLSELGLLDRQALIVIPHLRAVGNQKGKALLPNQTALTNSASSSSATGEGGYISTLRNLVSYLNPLSYFGGSVSPSTSVHESQRNSLQFGGSPGAQSDFTGSTGSNLVSSSQSASNGRNNNKSRQHAPSRFGSGSNIHTLKHDDDDRDFKDRNAFWNGNSTEYGGDE